MKGMYDGVTLRQFAFRASIVLALVLLLSICNSGDTTLSDHVFNTEIVAVEERGDCWQFELTKSILSKERHIVHFCPKFWSRGFGGQDIVVGMFARKNSDSDTIYFLESNRRFRGFVVFEQAELSD